MATVSVKATKCALARASYPDENFLNFSVASLYGPFGEAATEFAYIRFDEFGSAKHQAVTGVSVNLGVKSLNGRSGIWLYRRPVVDKFDYEAITYNNRPKTMTDGTEQVKYLSTVEYNWVSKSFENLISIKNVIENGVCVFPTAVLTGESEYSESFSLKGTAAEDFAPYLDIEYEAPEVYLSGASPSSGYVPKTKQTVFSWKINSDSYVIDGVVQESGTLQWRAGTSGTINSINVGTAQQYTIPGGTFTSDTIQWRVSVVAAGTTLTSDWYTLSTIEPTSTAEPLAPIGGFVDSTRPIAFSWDHVIETGTDQTAFELQYSADGSQFTTVASETTANEYTIVPAGTFAPGPLYWRVRTYNTDSAAGAWSAVVQTTAIGAPDAPVVTLDDPSPRPSVRWQSSGQQAYEVRIDGETVAKAFGVTKTYRAGTYLADGQHSISVRVQSQYGLWSEWGTVSIQIANMAGSAITLTAIGGNQASLTWTTEGAYDKYYIYRDGELIAKTTETSYDDALTNDAHIYQVRGAYDSIGDHGLSNAVNVVVRPETTILATVDGATSVSLPYSETNKRQTAMNTSRQMTAMYFAGSPLPSMEISEWTDRSMTITAALKPGESKTALLSLVGKIVCARDQYGNCVIGPLPGWTIRDYEMYTALQTTIQDVNWREAIKHDPIT